MKLSKPLGVITGLAVAVGSISPFCCSYSDIPVYADFGDLGGAVDYILSATGDDAVSASTGGNAVVRGIMLGIHLCTENPLPLGQVYDAGTISVIDGLYKYNDEVCIGYEWFTTNTDNYSNDQPFVFAQSKDFTITFSGPITSVSSTTSFNRYFTLSFNASTNSNASVFNSSGTLFSRGSYSPRSYQGNYYYYLYGDLTSNQSFYDWDRYPTTSLSDIFNVNFDSCSNVIRPQAIITLPSGDLDPVDPTPYINNVVRPYVEENYPEYIYLLPEPPQPDSQYATDDIVPGIPKDWTIINPDLPEIPNIDFTIPDADFSVLNPSEAIDDYSDGLGFWWALTDDILSTSDLRWLVLLGLSLAILAYILWMLGR